MTNNPEVVYATATHNSKATAELMRRTGERAVPLVRLADYQRLQADHERLQAECEELKRALSESRANDLTAMGYLNQIRELVGGDDFPDMVPRCEKLRVECERLRAAMIEAKGHISH